MISIFKREHPKQVDVVSVADEDPRYRDEEIINESLNQLFMQTRESDAKLRSLQSEQENFVIRYQESIRVTAEYDKATKTGNQSLIDQVQRQKEAYDLDLKNQAGEILHKRQELMDRHQRTFVTLQELLSKIINGKLVEVIFKLFEKFLTRKHSGKRDKRSSLMGIKPVTDS